VDFPVDPPALPHPILLDQRWVDLTFVHWAVEAQSVAHWFPPGTRPDVFHGATYVGLVPFAMRRTTAGTSLLLPYFDVDLSNPNGETTLFSVNNASATAVLAHVVVWSDLSVPVLDFNIYLTGYDVQTVNLRDILVSGIIPRTASAGQDPGDADAPTDLEISGYLTKPIDFDRLLGAIAELTAKAA